MHRTKASLVWLLSASGPGLLYQRCLAEFTPPPFCTVHVHPTGSRILLHRGSIPPCACPVLIAHSKMMQVATNSAVIAAAAVSFIVLSPREDIIQHSERASFYHRRQGATTDKCLLL